LALHAPHDRYRLAARAIPNNGFVGSNRGPATTDSFVSAYPYEFKRSLYIVPIYEALNS